MKEKKEKGGKRKKKREATQGNSCIPRYFLPSQFTATVTSIFFAQFNPNLSVSEATTPRNAPRTTSVSTITREDFHLNRWTRGLDWYYNLGDKVRLLACLLACLLTCWDFLLGAVFGHSGSVGSRQGLLW